MKLDAKWLAGAGIAGVIALLVGIQDKPVEIEIMKPAQEIVIRKVGEEIQSLRSEYSETVKADSGKLAVKIYQKRKRYIDIETGELKDYDLSPKEISVLAKLNPFRKHNMYVKIGNYAMTWFNDKPNDYKFIDPEGNYIKYTAIFDTAGIDISTIPQTDGVKQTYVMRMEGAVTELKWLVDTNTEMTYSENTGITYYDSDGGFLFRTGRPEAWDSERKILPIIVEISGDTLTYRIENPAIWSYPLTIDPSVTIDDTDALTGRLYAGADITWAAVRDAVAGSGIQTSAIYIGSAYDTPDYVLSRGLLRFDTSSIPYGAEIDSVALKVVIATDGSTTDFYVSVIEAHDTLNVNSFNTSMWNKFKGWAASGVYGVTYLSDSLSINGISVGDTLSFIGNAAFKDEINTEGTTNLWILSNKDIFDIAPTTATDVEFGDDSPYLYITYTIYANPPTGFTLHTPTTSQMTASWTNNHTDGIDSLKILSGAAGSESWFKTLTDKMDTTTALTGLTKNTQYIFCAFVDSAGIGGYSNKDTLYTLAAAPISWDFSEFDSTHVTISFQANGNPDSTYYAIRDSTRQKWIAISGDTTSTKTWVTRPAWLPVEINVNKNIRYTFGVVGKNGNGIETEYIWGTLSTNNKKIWNISALTSNNKWASNATYATARGQTSDTYIFDRASPYIIGQQDSASVFQIYRVWSEFIIPFADSVTSGLLVSTGAGDSSGVNFNVNIYGSTWNHGSTDDYKYYQFDGWQTGGTVYNGTNLINAWGTASDYVAGAAADTMVFNSSGRTAILGAKSDTLGLNLLSSRDVSATSPGQEFISLSSFVMRLTYYDNDHVPYDVTATALSSTSLQITWKDSSDTETGFFLANASGTPLADTTAANAEADTLTGLAVNTSYTIKIGVVGGKIDGLFSDADSCYTKANIYATPPVLVFSANAETLKVASAFCSTGTGNPSYTEYAVQDSILSRYIDFSATPDTLYTHADSLKWGTISSMGDSLRILVSEYIGKLFSIRAKAKSGQ